MTDDQLKAIIQALMQAQVAKTSKQTSTVGTRG